MRVDGRDISVSGSLLQPLTRRTNDILRLVLAAVFLATVITSSADHPPAVGRAGEVHLRRSSGCCPRRNPMWCTWSTAFAILALPFMILIGLIIAGSGNCWAPTRPPRLIAVILVVDQRQPHRGTSMALRPLRPAQHGARRSSSTTRGGSRCWRRC